MSHRISLLLFLFTLLTFVSFGQSFGDVPSVKIDKQVWMLRNLSVSTFANGEPIPEAKTAEEWKAAADGHKPAWCYYENDTANGSKYGKLYNWYAVSDPRGLAPKGWHVVSDNEWCWSSITSFLSEEFTAVASLKSTFGSGNNSNGMTWLPGGPRNYNGLFYGTGLRGGWWSSSESAAGIAWSLNLNFTNGRVYRNNYIKGCGFSVRCIKD